MKRVPNRQEFIEANPKRNGKDGNSLCLICGKGVGPTFVFCQPHRTRWNEQTEEERSNTDIITWSLSQPDFNGVDPACLIGEHFPQRPTAEEIYEALSKIHS